MREWRRLSQELPRIERALLKVTRSASCSEIVQVVRAAIGTADRMVDAPMVTNDSPVVQRF